MSAGSGVVDPSVRPAPAPDRAAIFETRWSLLLLAAVVLVVQLATLRAGQPWHDDFALYVLHARNLVEGRPYGETGYIYNPANPMHSPAVYPPGFPLLLAPVMALFGADLFALRFVVIAAAAAAVVAAAALARPLLPPPAVLAVAALFGLQPYMLRFKNLLLPDIPFTFFVLLSLLLIARLDDGRQQPPVRRPYLLAVATGACVFLAISLRMAGVALLAAIALLPLLRFRWPSRELLICVATALVLSAAQQVWLPAGSGYGAQMADMRSATARAESYGASLEAEAAADDVPTVRDAAAGVDLTTAAPPAGVAAAPLTEPAEVASTEAAEVVPAGQRSSLPARYLRRARLLFLSTDVLWTAEGELRGAPVAGVEKAFVVLLMVATTLLGLAGYLARLRRPGIAEAFMPAYVGMILVWGFPSARYLLPVLPLFIIYGLLGGRLLLRGGSAGRVAAGTVLAAVVLSYAVNLPRLPRHAYAGGVTGEAAVEAFAYIRTCMPLDARIVSFRPRAMALFTGREGTSISLEQLDEDGEYAGVMAAMAADYVFTFRESVHDRITSAHPAFQRMFENDRHVLYRYLPAGHASPLPPGCAP